MDSTSTGFSGIELFARFCPRIYSAISMADIFPVKVTYSPLFVSLQYTPRRSASGSVARTRSASFSFASLSASSHASGFSGFGYGAVGKWPSATACCGSMYTFQSQITQHTLNRAKTGSMQWCINNLDILCHLFDDLRMNG